MSLESFIYTESITDGYLYPKTISIAMVQMVVIKRATIPSTMVKIPPKMKKIKYDGNYRVPSSNIRT